MIRATRFLRARAKLVEFEAVPATKRNLLCDVGQLDDRQTENRVDVGRTAAAGWRSIRKEGACKQGYTGGTWRWNTQADERDLALAGVILLQINGNREEASQAHFQRSLFEPFCADMK